MYSAAPPSLDQEYDGDYAESWSDPAGSHEPSWAAAAPASVGVAQQGGAQPAPVQGSSGAAVRSAEDYSPRVARLTVASIDPFSALKMSFLLSVAAGIALVVASVVLWMVLDGIGVFDQLNKVLGDLGVSTAKNKFDIYQYVGLGRVVSLSVLIGIIDTVLLTALATITTFLYNLSAGLVGGIRVTLSDD